MGIHETFDCNIRVRELRAKINNEISRIIILKQIISGPAKTVFGRLISDVCNNLTGNYCFKLIVQLRTRITFYLFSNPYAIAQ